MNLNLFGWDGFFAQTFAGYPENECAPGRVIAEHRGGYGVTTETGEVSAAVSGRLRHAVRGPADFPAVGDWVVLTRRELPERGLIQAVLPRKSRFARRAAGGPSEAQLVAANVDVLFLVSGLDGDFNVRRIERYLVLAWESGANPVVVLNKADVCGELEERVRAVERVAPGVPVVAVSAAGGELDGLAPWLAPGRTVALLGSSGVGKSTIANRLLGNPAQAVGAVREDDSRGRHTTTSRQLLQLPGGALLIDTPGMRELQLLAGEDSLETAFADIEALARRCRFRDCGHTDEPGCAVQSALQAGALETARLESYRKLQREVAFEARRQERSAAQVEKERWKRIHKAQRERRKT
ncbi:ribosome small subunit-dependent GTPase A [Gloeobacter morelensis]|uniref:Small ribosomal subunit biogenesis GTPase RsgA n=1 Tax=Gloeobacter morelensis MG652769 TaxID=2781736 RepID=A0ABY3PGZ7_9CYAN|nr:ribosome small subunit-dependent GTPase A [Gloeobacter morelensis]UFP92901.1 ribosome small subunit-dependent GTPase A [Gloeobacter morelensis MG652769]